MRTVRELDHAGVSCMSIEDTLAAHAFGQPEGERELISTEEMVGKMKAAVEARGRSDGHDRRPHRGAESRRRRRHGGARESLCRDRRGRDIRGRRGTLDQVGAVHEAAKLPIIVGSAPASIKREDFAAARRARPAAGPPADRGGGQGVAGSLRAPAQGRRAGGTEGQDHHGAGNGQARDGAKRTRSGSKNYLR